MDKRKQSVFEERTDAVSITKDDKHATFIDTLKDMAESSSLHGIGKIVSSRQIVVKVLWGLLVLAALSVLSIQIYDLFMTYYSYPSQTSVSLGFTTIPFPAITVCNVNPVRKSQLYRAEDLLAVLNTDQINTRRRKRSIIKSTRFTNSQNKDSIRYKNFNSNVKKQLKNTQYTERFIEEGRRYKREVNNVTGETESPSTVTKASADAVTSSGQFGESTGETSGSFTTSKYVTQSDSPEITSASFDYPDLEYPDLNEDYFWDDWFPDFFDDDFFSFQLKETKDTWHERVENFKKAIKNKDLHLRKQMGHQMKDMMLNVTFAGRVQSVSKLQKESTQNLTSSDYGSCYTLANRKFVALRSGPSNAIKLTLNVEIDEYVDDISTGYGIRILFHELGTFPLPSHEGITLNPGTETNIGLRMAKISRLPEPHGDCIDGKEFTRKYRKKYSISACYEFCRISNIIQTCKCIPTEAPDDVPLNSTALPVCNTTEISDEKCMLEVNVDFDKGDISCGCNTPCKETVYTKTVSSTFWPTDDYLKVLISELCDNETIRDFWVSPCSDKDTMTSYELDKYRRNFLRVLIYFEDLNYEFIKEEPLYERVRFLSDIGGAMGLFMGASVLSCVELIQLILELILYIKHKK